MDNHTKLQQLVHNDKLSIIHLGGTTRSGSTIGAKILGQHCDVAFDGLFSKSARDQNGVQSSLDVTDNWVYNDFCGCILESVTNSLEEQNHVKIVSKGTSGRMSRSMFSRWAELPSSFIMTYRHPAEQFVSSAKAFYSQYVAKSSITTLDFLNHILPTIENTTYEHYQNSNIIQRNSYRWKCAQRELETIKTHCTDEPQNKQLILLESTLMRHDPERIWRTIFEKLGFDKKLATSLLNTPLTNVFSQSAEIAKSFKGKAYSSRSVKPLRTDEALDIETLPTQTRAHIRELELLYKTLLAMSENAHTLSLDITTGTPCFESGVSLRDVSPTTYSILKTITLTA